MCTSVWDTPEVHWIILNFLISQSWPGSHLGQPHLSSALPRERRKLEDMSSLMNTAFNISFYWMEDVSLTGERQKSLPFQFLVQHSTYSFACCFSPLQPVLRFGDGELYLAGSSFVLSSPLHEEWGRRTRSGPLQLDTPGIEAIDRVKKRNYRKTSSLKYGQPKYKYYAWLTLKLFVCCSRDDVPLKYEEKKRI